MGEDVARRGLGPIPILLGIPWQAGNRFGSPGMTDSPDSSFCAFKRAKRVSNKSVTEYETASRQLPRPSPSGAHIPTPLQVDTEAGVIFMAKPYNGRRMKQSTRP